jgi:hypothetical protein
MCPYEGCRAPPALYPTRLVGRSGYLNNKAICIGKGHVRRFSSHEAAAEIHRAQSVCLVTGPSPGAYLMHMAAWTNRFDTNKS